MGTCVRLDADWASALEHAQQLAGKALEAAQTAHADHELAANLGFITTSLVLIDRSGHPAPAMPGTGPETGLDGTARPAHALDACLMRHNLAHGSWCLTTVARLPDMPEAFARRLLRRRAASMPPTTAVVGWEDEYDAGGQADGSWPCGCSPPDARSARPRAARNCQCAGCWPNGPPPNPNPSSSGCPTCPPTHQWPPGPHRETALAHRARLPRDEAGSRPGPLRRPRLARLAPPCHPRLRRPRFLRPPRMTRSPKETASA